MYPELEKNNNNPDIKCINCSQGIDIFTEFNGDEMYDIECPSCGGKLKVKQEIYYEYSIIIK